MPEFYESNESTPRQNVRITDRGAGAGPPTPEQVDERAREIAVMEGRTPEEVTEEDRRRAEAELHGQTPALEADDVASNVESTTDPAEAGVRTGRRVADRPPPDEQQAPEQTFEEGVREAEHEQMLRGHVEPPPDEREPEG